MNFLKKAQAQSNKVAEATTPTPTKPVVPGARPTVPGAKPNIPGTRPVVPGAKPNIPVNKPTLPGVKPSVPVTKPVVEATETKEETVMPEIVEDLKAAGPIASKNPFKINKNTQETTMPEIIEETVMPEIIEDKKEEVVEVKEKEEIKTTEQVVEEVKVTEEVKEEVKEEVAEVKEESKKKTTSRRKKAKKTDAKTASSSTEDANDDSDDADTDIEVVIPKTEVSYAEAVLAIKSTFVDEEWEDFKTDTSERLGEIQISSDMTPSALKQTISDLNALRDSVWLQFLDCKTFFETLTAKDDGLIDRIKRLHSKGSNDNERKVNAAIALMNYKEDGKTINLYEVLDASRARYNYTKGLMESIQYKSNAVITMLGNLKLEK